jgi:hypothetical protein
LNATPLRSALSLLLAQLALPAQATTWVSLPPGYEKFPGNGAFSLPARWSQGTMQVIFDHPLLPQSLLGQTLKRVRVRRPAFVGEPPYPVRNLTFKLSVGIPGKPAAFLETDLAKNRPATPPATVVAGPIAYSIPATQPHGKGDAVAADLVDLPFTTPFLYPATSQGLYVEWETGSPALDIGSTHWVDAVYSFANNDRGAVFTTGNGGCGSSAAPLPMQLLPADSAAPALGTATRLTLRYARKSSEVWVLTGPLDTESVIPPFTGGVPFGASLAPAGAPGCHLWTGLLGASLRYTTDAFGQLDFQMTIPNDPLLKGQRLHLQAFCLDPTLNALRLAASNGLTLVPDELGLKGFLGTVVCLGSGCTASQWPAWINTAPVLLLGY